MVTETFDGSVSRQPAGLKWRSRWDSETEFETIRLDASDALSGPGRGLYCDCVPRNKAASTVAVSVTSASMKSRAARSCGYESIPNRQARLNYLNLCKQ